VIKNFKLFQPFHEIRQQARPHRTFSLRCGRHIKHFLGVFRLVQVIAEPSLVVLVEKIQFLSCSVDLRPDFLELVLLVFQAQFDVVERSPKVAGISGIQEFCQEAVAALDAFAGGLALLFKARDFIPHGLRLFEQRIVRLIGFVKRRILAN